MTQPKLQVKNCDLFYGDFQALKNINLSIAEKEITAFIGLQAAENLLFLNPSTV